MNPSSSPVIDGFAQEPVSPLPAASGGGGEERVSGQSAATDSVDEEQVSGGSTADSGSGEERRSGEPLLGQAESSAALVERSLADASDGIEPTRPIPESSASLIDRKPSIVLPAMPQAGTDTVALPTATSTTADRTGENQRETVATPTDNNSSSAEPSSLPDDAPARTGAVSSAPVAPATTSDGGRRRLGWGQRIGLGLLVLSVIAIIAGSFVRLPYYSLRPGSVYDTIERVEAPADLTWVPEGEISFVTVAQTADISVWQWVDAQLDSSVRLRHEDEVEGDQTAEEVREADIRRMQVSKSAAVVVALQRLGYELVITPLGIEVAGVFECTAADGVLGTGDLIVGVNGADVLTGEALVSALAQYTVGDEIELLVERIDPNNPAQSIRTDLVALTLGSADAPCLPDEVRADEPRAFIGISTLSIYDEELPVEINIRTGSVSGPSAGLAFTLAIMDVLSEGELTNGLNIVATGTIDREGNVGPVGGIHQKTITAERSGADLFLVPLCCDNFVDRATGEPSDIPSNYEEALRYADDMVVVGVDTLDDALRAIGELGGDVDQFLPADEPAADE